MPSPTLLITTSPHLPMLNFVNQSQLHCNQILNFILVNCRLVVVVPEEGVVEFQCQLAWEELEEEVVD